MLTFPDLFCPACSQRSLVATSSRPGTQEGWLHCVGPLPCPDRNAATKMLAGGK